MTHTLTKEAFLREVVRPGDAIIMRGQPGAGKSTLVDELKAKFGRYNVFVSSADLCRTVKTWDAGEECWKSTYVYDASKNTEIHRQCFREFLADAQFVEIRGSSVLVCDNTNTTAWEISPYLAVAALYDWTPVIVTLDVDPEISGPRNLHDVPVHQVKAMYDRIQKEALPQHWNHVIVKQ